MTRWSPEEDTLLKDQLAAKKIVARVVVPGRSPKNIRRRAYRLKLIEVAVGARPQGSWLAIKPLIQERGMTVRELVVETGFDTSSIANAIRTHRKEVHVCDYSAKQHARGRRSKVWRFGAGVDAVEPTQTDWDDDDDALLDDVDPVISMRAEARKRLQKIEESGLLIRRDELVEALYGRYVPSTTCVAMEFKI